MFKQILKNTRKFLSLRKWKSRLNIALSKNDDIYSMQIFQSLLVGYPYLPFNGGAIRPMGMAYVLNEIIINNRRNILEFGAGISTILLARLIERNKLDAKIVSIEHNKEWAHILGKQLKDEGLEEHVQILFSKLIDSDKKYKTTWYNESELNQQLAFRKFDFVIIDGPPANTSSNRFARYPAITFIDNKLKEDFCIFLDDSNRIGEQQMVKELKEKFPKNHIPVVSNTFFISYSIKGFNPVPFHYYKS